MAVNNTFVDLDKLKRRIAGRVLLPSHAQYGASCKLFNRAVHHQPAIIVKVRQASDIPQAIKYASKHKLRVSIRGGGHSAAGSGLNTGGMVIDTRALNGVAVLPGGNRVQVGAGALSHDVETVTAEHQRVLPMGTCSSVGVVGSSLGGGVGFFSKKYGLMCDCIEQITLVNAAGEFMQINQQRHQDLFWALRGAGANNFGVITQVEYKLFERPQMIFGGTISWPFKECKNIFQHYRDLLANASDDLFLYIYIPHAPIADAVVSLFGFYLADSGESEKIFEGMKSWAKPVASDLSYRPYADLQSGHFEEDLAVEWKHGFIAGQLCDDLIDLFVDIFSRCPENCGGIMLDPLGGAINRVDKTSSAFIHRDAQFICSVTGLYPADYTPNAVKQWVAESHRALQPFYNEYSYQNYEDLSLDEPQRYYGEHTPRLQALKAKYDPHNLFCGSLARSL